MNNLKKMDKLNSQTHKMDFSMNDYKHHCSCGWVGHFDDVTYAGTVSAIKYFHYSLDK